MLLFVGLGNPGTQYVGTRHNIGFIVVDQLHANSEYNFTPWKEHGKGVTSMGRIGTQKVLLLKPMTFMNSSGESIQEVSSYYDIPSEDVFVFYDDMDLVPGRVKFSTTSSSGGHNGIKSTLQHVGGDFVRVRIGIGHPGSRDKVVGYVLGKFGAEYVDVYEKVTSMITTDIENLISRNFNAIMSR